MTVIRKFGEMWARNPENIELIPGSKEGGQGVYVLYDGSIPVYIGMGNIRQRIRKARLSNRRGQMWDRFSWYIPSDPRLTRDIEALLLRMLPFYLRILNRQRGKLEGAEKDNRAKRHPVPEFIDRSKLPPKVIRKARTLLRRAN
jgi:hypothetical protein